MEGILRPSGTVSFLFTDVEGSTHLWELAPAAMDDALAAHDRLLRDTIGRFGGYVFSTAGDAFSAAFPTVGAALAAAVAAQHQLIDHPWPNGAELLVRMGVHVGAARERDGNYFGTVLNRTARIMGLASGGQVLLSATAVSMLADEPTTDVRLVDLGVHPLRGLSAPERLFAAVSSELPNSGRPLRRPTNVGNLPHPPTTFIGRSDELKSVAAAVRAHRLVTLIGPGGVGKTRLSIEVGHELVNSFADGVWQCELAPVEGTAVIATLASALGVVLRSEDDPVGQVVAALADLQLLVILDNCEHLLDAASSMVRRILDGASEVRVLATSRAGLGLSGEQLLPVAGLALHAPDLFCERAEAQVPDFSPDDADDAAIAEICTRLDNIPLAIELAAARVRTLRPADIATRLEDRFRLLRATARDLDPRHHTLLAAVVWSYDLLDQAEQCLFDRLSVFSGGFTLAAVEVVCADGSVIDQLDVLDLLDSLADKSLVQRVPSRVATRYNLLETFREFGRKKLEETARWRGAHGRYYRDLCLEAERQLLGPDEVTAWRTLDEDWDNIRAAFEHGASTGDTDVMVSIPACLGMYGMFAMRSEVGLWAREVVHSEHMLRPSDEQDLRGAWGLAAYFILADNTQRDEAVGLDHIDPANLGRGTSQLAGFLWAQNRNERSAADDFSRRWLEATTGPSALRLLALTCRAIYGVWLEDATVPAAELALEAASLAEQIGAPSLQVWVRWHQGLVVERTDPDSATPVLQDALETLAVFNRPHFLNLACRSWIHAAAAQGENLVLALQTGRDVLEASLASRLSATAFQALRMGSISVARAGHAPEAALMLGASNARAEISPATTRHAFEAERLLRAELGESVDELLAKGRRIPLFDAAAMAIQTINQCLAELAEP